MPAPSGQSPFVGRESELEQLRAAFNAAAIGQSALVMVAGEPGIGKTALCARLADHVTAQDGRALTGHCYEEGSLSRPYLPFIEALRPYVLERNPAELAEELGAGAVEVARILPELRTRLGIEPEPPASTDPEEARYRLYEAIASFLQNAARDRPLMLVLEDLHDADRGSLDLLVHLVRRQAGSRLLLLGTYRDVEVDRVHPLSAALAELRRVAPIERLHLRGLNTEQVQEMMESVAGRTVPPSLAAAVQTQTEGNPLFAQEVTRFLASEGLLDQDKGGRPAGAPAELPIAVPEGLREVIGKRLSWLSPDCNRLLALASVLGREFSLGSLRLVAGMSEEQLEEALEEATRSAVLEESTAGGRAGGVRYRFTHAFFRQTLYEELSAPRRIRLHQQVARALEAMYSRSTSGREDHAAELAEHFANSSDPADLEKAVRYGELAAQRAMALYAYGEAARYLERALEVQEMLDTNDDTGRCDLQLALCEALLASGERRRVSEIVAPQAFKLAEGLADRKRASHACQLALYALLWRGSLPATATAEYGQWLELADRYALPESIDRARTDTLLALRLYFGNQQREGSELALRALALARRLDDDDALFEAAANVMSMRLPAFQDERLQIAEEFARRPQGRASTRTFAYFYAISVRAFIAWGKQARAEESLRRAKEVAGRSGEAFGLLFPNVNEITLLAIGGSPLQSLTEAETLLARAAELGTPESAMQGAFITTLRPLCYLGRAAEALAAQPEPSRTAVAQSGSVVFSSDSALIYAHLGDMDRARELLGWIRDLIDRSEQEFEMSYPPLTNFLEAAILAGDKELAVLLVPRLAPIAGLINEVYPTVIARHLGAASALLGEREQALRYYEQALEVAGKVRFRPELALTHLQMAELLAEEGTTWRTGDSLSLAGEGEGEGEAQAPGNAPSAADDRIQALEHLDLAIPELRDMKMQPALERALQLEQRLRDSRAATSRSHPDGLSGREVEVLGLIAAGRSNNEVAAELVLSVHTVERHLANIYRKIGAANRTEAAAYAHRKRLA